MLRAAALASGGGALKGNPKGRSAAAATVRTWTLGLAIALLSLAGGGYYLLMVAMAAPRSGAAAAASPPTIGAAFSQALTLSSGAVRRAAGAAKSLFGGGVVAASTGSGSGGRGVPIAGPLLPPGGAAAGDGDSCGRGAADPDAWLDKVAEPGCAPKIEPSWYAQVHGIEPFERADTGNFQLHVTPTDEWYDRAKRATDRCDLELHEGIQNGACALKYLCIGCSSAGPGVLLAPSSSLSTIAMP